MGSQMAIPTVYEGVRFRSRLEARWAAFFDSIGWPWEYERRELKNYIPDFACDLENGELLVEVKPATHACEMREARAKIERSGWIGEALIVGYETRFRLVSLFGEATQTPWGTAFEWSEGELFHCMNCGRVSVFASAGSWHCRRCGVSWGKDHVSLCDYQRHWTWAGNAIQWRPAV